MSVAVCDCDADTFDDCRCDVVDVADDDCSHYINVQVCCLRLRSVILIIII